MLLPLALTLSLAQADEGMWLPEQLPARSEQLAALGLEISPEQLADPMGQPLGSIVTMGFCSASFLSADGLLATNHHCVSSYLQYLSDEEHDRNTEGHLAADRSDELWVGPGSEVQVVEKISDVTAEVMRGVRARTSDPKREARIRVNRARIIADCEEDRPNIRCRVAPFYGGQTYRLIEKRRLRDVRMVYAPPESVGSYGGEIDNWMWPRHTGDFALLRAYVAPDGSAAEHAEDNVPYQPRHHLELNPAGVGPGDFVMVAGYPGSTYRFRQARSMRFSRDVRYPFQLGLYDELIAILQRHIEGDAEAAAKLTANKGYLDNGRKYTAGMLDGFSGSDVVSRKEAGEAELKAWIAADPARVDRYEPVLHELDLMLEAQEQRFQAETLAGWLVWAGSLLRTAHTGVRWATEQQKPDLEREPRYQDRDKEKLLRRFERLDASLHLPADREVFELFLSRAAALPSGQDIPGLTAWIAQMGGTEAALDALYAEPALAGADARKALLDQDLAELQASTDPWVQLALVMEAHLAPLRARDKVETGARLRLMPVYYEALKQAQPADTYPDANSTLRITAGQVKGYAPRDGLLALPQTTVAGVVAKAGDWPFDAPEALLEAAPAAPESRWADDDLGDVPVNFLANLDTTGGNSGSATLDAQGRFVGLIFDGNYEAMSADWLFDEEMTRSIHVDVRYMLWVIEEVARATWILEELGVAEE